MAVTLNMGTISLDCRIHYSILRFWSTAHTLFVSKQKQKNKNKNKKNHRTNPQYQIQELLLFGSIFL